MFETIIDGVEYREDDDLDEVWKTMREIRLVLLEESDVYTLMDRWNALTETEQNELTIYKQALRDLPDNIGAIEDIWDMEFPTPPSFMVSMHS